MREKLRDVAQTHSVRVICRGLQTENDVQYGDHVTTVGRRHGLVAETSKMPFARGDERVRIGNSKYRDQPVSLG